MTQEVSQASLMTRINMVTQEVAQVSLMVRTNVDPEPPGGDSPFTGFAHTYVEYYISGA